MMKIVLETLKIELQMNKHHKATKYASAASLKITGNKSIWFGRQLKALRLSSECVAVYMVNKEE